MSSKLTLESLQEMTAEATTETETLRITAYAAGRALLQLLAGDTVHDACCIAATICQFAGRPDLTEEFAKRAEDNDGTGLPEMRELHNVPQDLMAAIGYALLVIENPHELQEIAKRAAGVIPVDPGLVLGTRRAMVEAWNKEK